MRKKFICGVVAAAALSVSTCYAEIEVKTELNNITVTAKAEAGTDSTIVLVKDGGTLDSDSDIYAMKMARADENGNLTFNFSMPDDMGYEYVENVYDIYIKNENQDVIVYDNEITYVTVEHRNTLMSEIENAKTYDSLMNLLDNRVNANAFRVMGADIEGYNSLGDKKSVCEMYLEYESEDVISGINTAIAVGIINEGTDDSYMSEIGFEFENVKYTDISDSNLKAYIDNYISSNRKFKKIEDIFTAYNCANALYIISNSRFDKMEDNLAEYADILGITKTDEYEEYLECNYKNKVNEILAKVDEFKTVSDLLSDIEAAISDAKPKKSSPSSSGGGGGGGSRSGNAVSTISTVTVPTVSEKEYFDDIKNVEWAKEAVNKMAEMGYISGDENGKFNPNNNVTREEFVKMLVTAAGLYDENAKADFSDVSPDAWYASYVASAYKNGLINGVTENEFGTEQILSRQDMATICYRVIKKAGALSAKRDFDGFADMDEISEYALEAVTELYKADMINGTGGGLFSPQFPATRAQSAVMIYNLLIK